MAESWFDALADEAANGVSATAAVGAVLGGAAGAAVAGASVAARMADAAGGGGGSWSFDKDDIDAVIKDWKALAKELEEDRLHLSSISSAVTQPPSEDEPSLGFMKSVLEGVSRMGESHESMYKYILDFIDKLELAKRSIVSGDGLASETFSSSEGKGV
ncbi:hypothetical protein AB8O38_12070 [Saccharomonospora xinjiangensis]|uniref:hypothetical protein n=1 Tax=Saccharomonospora xinjiangensis TaxID=75294 RepID=UPI0035103C00